MAWTYDRTGDHLAVNFANTAKQPLGIFGDLVEFARQMGLLSDEGASALLARGERDPARIEALHREALKFRDALFRGFTEGAGGGLPAAADLEVINRYVARLRIGPRLGWEFASPDGLDGLVGPIVQAAAELLTGDQRRFVRVCGAPDCG